MIAVSPPSRAQSASMQPPRYPLDDLLQSGRVVVRHGHVVEEEQRLGAAAERVVDAHRHQVDADRVVHAGQLSHLQLRAHAVGAGNQHRLLILAGEQGVGKIELEQPGESAVVGNHPRAVGAMQQLGQPGHRSGDRPRGRRPHPCKSLSPFHLPAALPEKGRILRAPCASCQRPCQGAGRSSIRAMGELSLPDESSFTLDRLALLDV